MGNEVKKQPLQFGRFRFVFGILLVHATCPFFRGKPSRAKGREHIGQAVGWAVLAHNLWVLARWEIALRQSEQQAA